MKKLLLSASMLMLAGASAFAATDGQTYETIDGFKCENLWVLDRQHTEADFNASKLNITNGPRMIAIGDNLYVGSVPEGGAILSVFDIKTGEHKKDIALKLENGDAYNGTLVTNGLNVDEYGHVVIAPYAANSDGTGAYTIYTVDLETGIVKLVAELPFAGTMGRVDFSDIIGDVTGTEANCTIMAAVGQQNGGLLDIFQWVLKKGTADWIGGWTGGAFSASVKETAPTGVANFGNGVTVRIVRDGSKSGNMNLFYVDGSSTFPVLYGTDLAAVDKLTDADLIVKDKETHEVVSGTVPSPEAGPSGIWEFTVSGQNFCAWPICQPNDGAGGSLTAITAVDEERAFTSTKYLWTVPADGLGTTGGIGRRQRAMATVDQKDGSVLFAVMECYNGMGVYRISKPGSVESNVVAAANITVNGDVIAVSEVAETIEVFNVAGQKVAEARNASEVAAPATGAYIVKAVVAGAPVVKKVIL